MLKTLLETGFKKMRFIHCICLLSAMATIGPSAGYGQSLTSSDIDKIERLSDIICNQLYLDGSSSSFSLSAEAEAEARLLLRSLGSGEAEVDVEGFISRFENVPRDQLAEFLKSAQDCRLEVFRDVRSEANNSSQPQAGQLAWNFPHVIEDNIALGVINVRAGGKGVDINWRLRNTGSEVQYVKFGGSSYTDHSGNICQKGSLTTSVSGIPYRRDEAAIPIGPGDSIQFSSNNVRCDGTAFTDSGDIISVILAGSTAGNLKEIRYEIASVETIR